jgi:hypothetical protein
VKLYRMFRLDADNKPLVGTQFGMLGVRPRDPANPRRKFDVKASTGSDTVQPHTGGLSVFTDPTAIHLQSADMVLCELESDDLPAELSDVAAGEPHHHIEPSKEMTLDQFQALLESTRDDWHPVPADG